MTWMRGVACRCCMREDQKAGVDLVFLGEVLEQVGSAERFPCPRGGKEYVMGVWSKGVRRTTWRDEYRDLKPHRSNGRVVMVASSCG